MKPHCCADPRFVRPVAILLLLLCVLTPVRAQENPWMCMNLDGIGVLTRSRPFTDVVKSALNWGSADAPWNQNAAVDANGWPTGDAGIWLIDGTLAFTQYREGGITSPIAPPDLGGTYKLSFQCNNAAEVTIDAWGEEVKNIVRDNATKTITADIVVNPGADKNLFLSFRKTSGGVRNVRVLRPGYTFGNTPTFTREFVDVSSKFKVLRYMDWLNTNSAPTFPTTTLWNNRRTTTYAFQTGDPGRGVAWEYIIELANTTNRDLWINIPVAADDTYVRQLANLLYERLAPNLRVYVEYSNEVWNSGFPQFAWNREVARDEVSKYGQTNDPIRLNENVGDWRDDGNSPDYQAFKRVSKRLLQISAIFRDVFKEKDLSPQDPSVRIRPVLASLLSWPYVVELQLLFIQKYYGPPRDYLYGIAGAPYLNLGEATRRDDLTVAQINDLYKQSANALLNGPLTSYVAFARYYRLHALCYEGGTDNASGDGQPHSLKAKYDADYSATLGTTLKAVFNDWFTLGGGQFMYFSFISTYTKWGMWGISENISNPDTPKFKAIDDTLKTARPTVVGGALIGITNVSTVSTHAYVESIEPRAMRRTGGDGIPYIDGIQPLTHFDYLLNVARAGTYNLSVETASAYDGGELELSINNGMARIGGATTARIAVPNSGTAWRRSTLLSVTLSAGQHTLRLNRSDVTFGPGLDGFKIRRIQFQPATATFVPVADSFVHDGTPTANYGARTGLITKTAGAGGNRWSIFRFDTTNLNGGIRHARFRIYGGIDNIGAKNLQVICYAATSNWAETSITFNNRPTLGTGLRALVIPDNVKRYYEFDLTEYVRAERNAGRRVISVYLRNNTASEIGITWNSRESAVNKPELVLTPE